MIVLLSIPPRYREMPGMPTPLAIQVADFTRLLWFGNQNITIGLLAAAIDAKSRAPDVEWRTKWRDELMAELAFQQRLRLWVATHPDASLPFDPASTDAPALPAWCEAIDDDDLPGIALQLEKFYAAQVASAMTAPVGIDADWGPVTRSAEAADYAADTITAVIH